MEIIKTVLADDQRIFIEGLKKVLVERQSNIEIVAVAYNGLDLLQHIQNYRPALLIYDLNLPEKDGLEVLQQIRTQKWPLKVLVLSRYHHPRIVKSALKAGVDGYILKNKNVDELFRAIEAILEGDTFFGEGIRFTRVSSGSSNGSRLKKRFGFEDGFVKKYNLTKRELEILHLITDALSNKQIAKELYISDQTVSVHRKNIMRKLGVSNTAALIKTAYENSLV